MISRTVLRAALALVGLSIVLSLILAIFGLPVLESLGLIVQGALGDKFALARTAVKSAPLLLTGLGMAVAWRAGMYNIGGEGQFIAGGLGGAAAAHYLMAGSAHGALAAPAILGTCVLGGALWAGIAAWLHAARGVDVVISTILMNFIALQLLSWAVSGPLQEPKGQLPFTQLLPDAYMLPRPDRQTDLHLGVLFAAIAALICYAVLFGTKFGFRLRLVGASARAARANRISVTRSQVGAMLLSGGLCGLAGGIEYIGISGQLGATFAAGWGFLGIPVALLAGLHPLVVPCSALFFGAVLAGSENLARFSASGTTLIYVVQGAAVLGLVALKALSDRRAPRTAEQVSIESGRSQ